jgi:hypothetical protein
MSSLPAGTRFETDWSSLPVFAPFRASPGIQTGRLSLGRQSFITSRSSHALYPAESSPRPSDGPLTTKNLQSRDLLRAIFEARNAMCSNSRDKVFALLGLAARDPLSSKNHPNYTTSDVKVYERLASTYTESKKNCNILFCCNRVAVPRGFLDGMSAYSTHSSTDTSVSRLQYTMQLARPYRSIYIHPWRLEPRGFPCHDREAQRGIEAICNIS